MEQCIVSDENLFSKLMHYLLDCQCVERNVWGLGVMNDSKYE